MKSLTAWLQSARDLIRHEPIRDAFYSLEEGGDGEVSLSVARNKGGDIHVCSIGAMRLAFVRMMGDDPSLLNKKGGIDENKVKEHPFYVEGMRLLGQAFYKEEMVRGDMLDLGNKEVLVGRSTDAIETAVMNINDDREVCWEAIWTAFDEAVDLARAKEREENTIGVENSNALPYVEPMEPADETNGNQPLTQAELELMIEARDSVHV